MLNLVTSEPAPNNRPQGHNVRTALAGRVTPATLTATLLGVVLLWSYWPTLTSVADRWARDPQYSHGFLVPLFAAALLWMRRHLWTDQTWQPSAWGCLSLAAAVFLRLEGARLDIDALDAFSLLPMLAGLVLVVGGKALLRWSWPAIAFLGFMLPLPFALEQGLSQPLRRLATVMSAYLLETLGYPAVAEGNVILIDEARLGVADACSGLGMLMTFFALSTAFAMLLSRRWLDKTVIVLSAVPIAVLANVLRITATGAAHVSFGRATARVIMHDVAGWLMMPLALGMLALVLWLLDHTLQEVEDSAPLMILPFTRSPAVSVASTYRKPLVPDGDLQ